MGLTTAKQERVAGRIRADIQNGAYADGESVNQSEMAAECGVHRCVVSSALYHLQDEGWVTYTEVNGQRRFVANVSHVSRQLQRVLVLVERLDIMARQLDGLCRYLLPSRGPYSAPYLPSKWE